MQAWMWERYGPPELLRLAAAPLPTPSANEVLIRVRAASVNAADWHSMRGRPVFSRLTLGVVRPKHRSLGVDVAGVVQATGGDVTTFAPGDEVYANLLEHGYGGFAEYVSAPADAVGTMPRGLSFVEAAAIPMSGGTALQGLRHHGAMSPAQKVLINGGTGGVGSFAVQIAKSSGAEVTVVTSPHHLDLVRSLGADHVVDHTTTDFADGAQRYDLILDTVGNRSVADLRRALAEGGRAAVTGFTSVRRLLDTSLRGRPDVAQVSAHVGSDDLRQLSELVTTGALRPVIDRTYPFDELPAAIAHVERGHTGGKIVVESA